MPLRRIVLLALAAGAVAAFVAALLRPRARPHMLATREEVEALVSVAREADDTDQHEAVSAG